MKSRTIVWQCQGCPEARVSRTVLLIVSAVALLGCGGGNRTATPSTTPNLAEAPAAGLNAGSASEPNVRSVAPAAASAVSVLPNSNMTDDELKTFYHLSEGSEVFPVSWLLALRTESGGRFVDNLSKYGLLADPEDPTYNPYGLPVGMTSAVTLDLRLFKLPMVGFNCAACHVGQIQAAGRTFTVVGAPNLFDINGFFVGLGDAVKFTLKDKYCNGVVPFLRNLVSQNERRHQKDDLMLVEPTERAPAAARQAYLDAKTLLEKLPADDRTPSRGILHDLLDQMHHLCETESARDIARDLQVAKSRPGTGPPERGMQTCFEQDDGDPRLADPSLDPGVTAVVARIGSGASAPKFVGTALSKSLETTPDPAADLGELLPDLSRTGTKEQIRARALTAVGAFLENWAITIRLLKTRLKSLETLAHGVKGKQTPAGPGRVDAFMTAHNLMFPQQPSADMTSPVSYPRLWNIAEMGWLHWDANTTSVIQRNVGQAAGLGAVVDAQYNSTICIRNIHALEVLARKITPPQWPKELAQLDAGKVKSGEHLFDEHCAGCHAAEGGLTTDAPKVGTDPNRATSFAMHMADKKTQFVDALRIAIEAISTKAYDREKVTKAERQQWDPNPEWQVTRAYVRRPLAGVWATAPYLHNASVPTLADLLLWKQQRRPDAFSVGDRTFDTERVGYRPGGSFPFDATGDGNKNDGHLYGTKLPDDDKGALIEYLKSLPTLEPR